MLWSVLYALVVTLLVVVAVIQLYRGWYESEAETEAAAATADELLLGRKRRLKIAEPLPQRQFRQPDEVEPPRSQAGTLIPLVVHVWEDTAWDAVAEAWQTQGWLVRRWPSVPSGELLQRYYGAATTALSRTLWPYLIVYDQGGLFATQLPATTRSLKNYLIYTGFDVAAVYFRDQALQLVQTVLAAQAHHVSLQMVLEGSTGADSRKALQDVRILEAVTFLQT